MRSQTKRSGSSKRVIFPGRAVVASILQAKRHQQPPAQPHPRPKAQHHKQKMAAAKVAPMVPDLFTSPPPIKDDLETTTSTVQEETEELCLPYLAADSADVYNQHGLPHIHRERHIAFLQKQLGKLPAPYVGADASRPWFLYWCFNAMRLLGEDVSSYRETLIETARSMQNDTGGFGGGNGQLSHLATTYAIVLSLALVGGEQVYDLVDRRALWKWLCSLKTPGGGFQMAVGGEVDVRGAYCAAVIVSLLNLPLDLTPDAPAWTPGHPTLFTNLADYVQKCQTFEGGISAHPNAEAHGAYAFCALGCLAILDSPDRIIPRLLDVSRLISWLSSRQYAPEGGFSGRTNKLVDGCYSHWVGGCWPLIEAALSGSAAAPAGEPGRKRKLAPYQQSLYSREGLIRYTMCCCQDLTKRGGLRDKPGRPSDAYHSCYVLSGLSSAQHKWELAATNPEATAVAAMAGGNAEDQEEEAAATAKATAAEQMDDKATAAAAALATWSVTPYLDEAQVFDEQDRLVPLHPVYAVPAECVADIKAYFGAKQGF